MFFSFSQLLRLTSATRLLGILVDEEPTHPFCVSYVLLLFEFHFLISCVADIVNTRSYTTLRLALWWVVVGLGEQSSV